MRILFAAGRRFFPEKMFGAERSTHTLLQNLIASGHNCEAAAVASPGWRLLVSRIRSMASSGPLAYLDQRNGYPTHRSFPGQAVGLLAERISNFRPDLVVALFLEEGGALVRETVRAGTPVLVSILDNDYRWLDGPLPASPLVGLICNSCFTRDRAREQFGLNPEVIYPSVSLTDYSVRRVEPSFITFVNPVHHKGLDTALRLAMLLPHRRFQFVRGWELPWRWALRNERRVRKISNITYRNRTRDMRSIYARTSLLIVPSIWEESFGRVILEAHASGIPVIATRIGGIPEALGAGGLLLPPGAPAEEWAKAVESVLNDEGLRATLSAQARANSARPEFDTQRIARRFLEVASAHMAQARP